MSGPILRISVCWVFGLHYIKLLAGLWRKKWSYCETLIVYVCISGLSFKNALVKKVHGLSGSMSKSYRGHTVAYQCKGLDQNNVVCEYEVNMLTNEKVILEQNHRIAYILVTSRIIEQFSTSFYIFDRFLKIFTYIAGNLIQIKQAYKNLRSSSFCCWKIMLDTSTFAKKFAFIWAIL